VTRRVRPAIVELSLARFRLFVREPSAVFWTFGFPVVLAVALGIAFRSRPPEPILVAVEAGNGAERTLSELTAARGGTPVKARIEDTATARTELRVGKVVLVVAAGPPRTYVFDEQQPEGRAARLVVDDILQRAEGRVDPTAAAEEHVTEVGARYIDFLVPGLIGMTLMSGSMWGIGYAIVELRTKKLVKRMLATPMRKSDFLLSFVVMRAAFALLETPVLVAFGCLVFGMRVPASAAALIALTLLGALAFAGLGLLVACRAQNTQTVGGLMNLVMMPMFIGSGVFFSTAHFPDSLQPVIHALPLTMLNDGLRAAINEGAGMRGCALALVGLTVWTALSFGAALRFFRWR
jgi:ABC-type multidrug transport system permease subunit